MSSLAQALISYAQSGGKNDSSLLRALSEPQRRATAGPFPPHGQAGIETGPPGHSAPPTTPYSGSGKLNLPTSWKGTHVTDGLGWGTSSAEDIMAHAGTPVGAPESGTVEYFHPTGAQGGGSMMFKADSGREYWLGHIAGGIAAGSRVPKGGRIAYVSADHPAPHVHIDSR